MGLFKKHPIAVTFSVLFHLGLVAFFIVGVDFFDEPVVSKPSVNVVKATVIDESKVRAEAEKLKKLDQKKKLQEKRRLDQLKADRLKEEKRLADLKKKQSDEKKKIEQLKVAEAARLAKLKQQQADAIKKKVADKKKKEAADKLKKAEDAKKRAIAKEKQEQADRLSAMLEAAHNEEQELQAQKAINSYSNIIRQKVERNWIQPAGDMLGLSCIVRVKLIPGGEVVDADITKGSGNALFDRSVELATLKASPLPIPDDPALFKQFRNLEFIFDPSAN